MQLSTESAQFELTFDELRTQHNFSSTWKPSLTINVAIAASNYRLFNGVSVQSERETETLSKS